MSTKRDITAKPLAFGMTGFTDDDLVLKNFLEEVKKRLPNAFIAHIGIAFSDTKDFVSIGHDYRDGKHHLERVDVEGSNYEQVDKIVEALNKVLSP